jgi:hypothetical protein
MHYRFYKPPLPGWKDRHIGNWTICIRRKSGSCNSANQVPDVWVLKLGHGNHAEQKTPIPPMAGITGNLTPKAL